MLREYYSRPWKRMWKTLAVYKFDDLDLPTRRPPKFFPKFSTSFHNRSWARPYFITTASIR